MIEQDIAGLIQKALEAELIEAARSELCAQPGDESAGLGIVS